MDVPDTIPIRYSWPYSMSNSMAIVKCVFRKFGRYRNFFANFVLILCVTSLLIILILNDQYDRLYEDVDRWSVGSNNTSIKSPSNDRIGYDFNQSCKFPILDPFDQSILAYVKHPYQIYCQNVQPDFTYPLGNYLYVDTAKAKKSGLKNLQYKFLIRTSEKSVRPTNWTEWSNLSQPILLTSSVTVQGGYGLDGESPLKTYLNTYSSVYVPDHKLAAGQRIAADSKMPKLNVFIFGVDSVSRSNFVRNLPKTYDFLINRMKSYDFRGYSKIDDNTFPNLLALLTGHKVSIHNSELRGHFQKDYVDSWPFVWKNFSAKGYVTALMEEQPGFMSYKAKGFEFPPTDVYLRPFGIVLNKSPLRQYSSPACVGNKAEARHYLESMERFVATYRKVPSFLFSFLWKLSHDKTSDVEMLDPMIYRFFKGLFENDYFNNTILIVMSDHGNRFDAIRKTLIGRFEERMPYLSIYLPPWFKSAFPDVTANLHTNVWRLSCQYDVYETLVDVLNENYRGAVRRTFKNRGNSLLTAIPATRTCYDAHIPGHFCVCQEEENLDVGIDYVKAAAEYVVEIMNTLTLPHKKLCRRLYLNEVISAQKYKANERVLLGVRWHFKKLLQDKNVTGVVVSLRVALTTNPNNGAYEALVQYMSDQKPPYKFSLKGSDISRINSYGKQADCISMVNRNLEKFCYCKKSWL